MSTKKTDLNPEIVKHLVSACKQFTTADNSLERAKNTLVAKTESMMAVAIEIGTKKHWDEYRKELDRVARTFKTAKERHAIGYEKHKTSHKGAATFIVRPRQSLKNVFSVIRQALDNSIALVEENGEPRTFNAVKSEKAKVVAKRKAKALTGRPKDMHDLDEWFNVVKHRAKNLDDTDLHNIVKRLNAEVLAWFPTAKESKKAA